MSDWELLDEPEIRGCVACLLVGPVVGVGHLLGLGTLAVEGLVAGLVVLLAPFITRAGALLLGLTGWGVITGFVTHELGQLAFGRSDLVLMGGLVVAALLAPAARGGQGTLEPVMEVAAMSPRRWVRGAVVAVVGLPLLTLVVLPLRSTLTLATEMLFFLLLVLVIALVGGRWPAIAAGAVGSLVLNFFFTPPFHTFEVADPDNVVSILAFVLVTVLVSWAVDLAVRRTQQVAEAAARAEALEGVAQLRSALLTAVGHDLRTPLAVAKAGVSGARSTGLNLAETDRAALLGSANHALDRLTSLVDTILDLSRLQTGASAVRLVPVPVDEVVVRALDDLAVEPRGVLLDIPAELPQVLADAGLLERVVANLVANAQRYAGDTRPPEVRAEAAGTDIEIRVVDHGPGIHEADWERVFQPFQRLGDTAAGSGVGLGLALVRSLVEAMGGVVHPEHTPSGGLTMVVRLPAEASR